MLKGIKPVPEVLPTHKGKDLSRYAVAKHPVRELPYQTKSICPFCRLEDEVVSVIDATVYEEDGRVMMKKTCNKHGEFVDVYWSDVEMFKRVMPYWYKTVASTTQGPRPLRAVRRTAVSVPITGRTRLWL